MSARKPRKQKRSSDVIPKTLQTQNVNEGVGGARIRTDRYEVFRDAILDAVPDEGGITLKELGRELAAALAGHTFDAKGSVTWYMMTVKLDLEARGLIERVPGARPQRLRRVR